jgi:hypothetical protein
MPAGTFPSRDLIGQYEVLLHPVDGRGLVPPAVLVVGQGFPLVALLDRGIVVEGRRGVPALRGHPVDQGRIHVREALESGVLRGDVGDPVGGPLRLGLEDQLVVVERVQEVAQGVGRGEAAPQEAGEPRIGLEHTDVVEALAPGGEEEDQGFDLRRLGVAALALADVDVLGDRFVQPEGPQRLHDEGQPGPAGHGVGPLDHFDGVRQQALAHRGDRRRGVRLGGGALWRSARLTAVRALTIAQSSA